MAKNWHFYDLGALEKKLKTSISNGLSGREASVRLESVSDRERGDVTSLFVPKRAKGIKDILWLFLTPSVLLLSVISLIVAIFGKAWLGGAVLAVMLIGSLFCGIVKLKAQKRLEVMKNAASPMIRVKRSGNLLSTDGRNIVAGDVIFLSEGDVLPCDARLIYADKLAVDELIFADGKLVKRRVEKDHEASYTRNGDEIKAPDALNTVYAGSAVVSGEAIALVTDVGREVYLADHIPDGSLAGKDAESEAVQRLRPTLFKVTFLAMASVLVLSLIGLLTLQKYDFIYVFLMILCSTALMSAEVVSVCASSLLSSSISGSTKKGRKRSTSFSVRNIKAIDQLSDVTDLIFIGKAGLTDGISIIRSVYTASGLREFSPDKPDIKRISDYIFTYIKALSNSGIENDFYLNGYSESLTDQLKNTGYDVNGAELALKSLYFAPDGVGGCGFACAETANDSYRATLVFNTSSINSCRAIRDGDRIRNIYDEDREALLAYEVYSHQMGQRCMCIISESDGTTVFEGAVALGDDVQNNFTALLNELKRIGVKPLVFLPYSKDEADILIKDKRLSSLFDGKIAYADDFKSKERSVLYRLGEYCAYVGFENEEFILIINEMKKLGSRVATLGIDNKTNEIMARANLTISCDDVDYTLDSHRVSSYERLSTSGRDTNLRCSQQTRLLSKVLIRRGRGNTGGLSDILTAIRAARGANLLLTCSLELLAKSLCAVLLFAVLSVIMGKIFMGPVQVAMLSMLFTAVSLKAFSNQTIVHRTVDENRDYSSYPLKKLTAIMPEIILRTICFAVFALVLRVIDLVGVFGENADMSFALSISIACSFIADAYLISRSSVMKGKNRTKIIVASLVALIVTVLFNVFSLIPVIRAEMFIHTVSWAELIIIPAYLLVFTLTVFLSRFIGKKSNR